MASEAAEGPADRAALGVAVDYQLLELFGFALEDQEVGWFNASGESFLDVETGA